MKFSGKNVLITGASRGIGASIAENLAGMGLKVWINYRSDPAPADELKAKIESSGGVAALIKFDASDENGWSEAIKLITESDGELSYLVNNAGITNDKLALRMSESDFTSVIDANLKSAFLGCKEALKVMSKKRFGAVVNIASIVGEMGNAGQVNYAASKGGMIAMSKSFAKEGASRSVRYNCVTPGFIETDMTAVLKEDYVKAMLDTVPMKRGGKPEDIANVALFLASDMSSYVTGQVIGVDGGMGC